MCKLILNNKTLPEGILNKLTEISTTLKSNNRYKNTIGLMTGATGVATFFFYYYKLTNKEEYYDYGYQIISSVLNKVGDEYNFHTFSSGIGGVGWNLEHLAQNNFIENDTNELLGGIDNYLYKKMIWDIKLGNYDLLHGAIGNGIYFLNRLNNNKFKNYLIKLVDYIEEISIINKDGSIKWQSILKREEGIIGYNLGLSHGIASIIAFLSKLYEQKIYMEKVFYLLNGAVKYLLQQSLNVDIFRSNFPSWVTKSNQLSYSRLAWCYGDLGIGVALWNAGQSTSNQEWKKKSIEVLLHSTRRVELKENQVVDAGLCHGTAGIAHIFNRMHGYTGLEELKEASDYWFEQTLKMANFKDGLAGYKSWRGEQEKGVNDPGLLEGIAGIGLAMISAISDIDLAWDECLLLS